MAKMSEASVMKAKANLTKEASKKGLSSERAGAYIFGTLRHLGWRPKK